MTTKQSIELRDPQGKPRKLPVGVTFAPDDLQMLSEIQRTYNLSRSATIRACVHKVYSMLQKEP